MGRDKEGGVFMLGLGSVWHPFKATCNASLQLSMPSNAVGVPFNKVHSSSLKTPVVRPPEGAVGMVGMAGVVV